MYSSINVLEVMLNNVAAKRMVPSAIILGSALEITAAFATIRLHGIVPLPGFFIFPLDVVGSGVGIFMLTTACAALHGESENLLMRWRKGFSVTKYYTRRLRALKPIRVKCGQNFMDRTTPLVIQDFCVNQLVSLLLMFP